MQLTKSLTVLFLTVAPIVTAFNIERQARPTLDPGHEPDDYMCTISFILTGCCFRSTAACKRQGRNDCDRQDICPEGVTKGSNGTPGCEADCCSTTTGFGIGCPK